MDADIYVVMKRQPFRPTEFWELSLSPTLSLFLFLSWLVDANSYPLVFPRNLALSLPPGKFLRPRFRYRSHLPDRRFRSH